MNYKYTLIKFAFQIKQFNLGYMQFWWYLWYVRIPTIVLEFLINQFDLIRIRLVGSQTPLCGVLILLVHFRQDIILNEYFTPRMPHNIIRVALRGSKGSYSKTIRSHNLIIFPTAREPLIYGQRKHWSCIVKSISIDSSPNRISKYVLHLNSTKPMILYFLN